MNLSSVNTKDLLTELFSRYKEGIFIGNAGGMDPIHMSTHLPTKSTNMHSVLIVQLTTLLNNLRKKYPEVTSSCSLTKGQVIPSSIIRKQENERPCAFEQ